MLGTRPVCPLYLLAVISLFIMYPRFSQAEMIAMSDLQMEAVVGTGPVDLSIVGDVVRAELNLPINTFTEMESLKLGYHANNALALGWDQNWTHISLGSSAQDLVINGIYIEMTYENINDSALRNPTSVKIGTGGATGPVSAVLDSFSGDLVSGSNTTSGNRIALGSTNLTLDQSEGYITLQFNGDHVGYSVYLDNATIN